MTEKQIQQAVVSHWKALGLPGTLVAAVPNAGALGQPGLYRGLYDLIVIGGPFLRDRTGWIELKTDKGVPSQHQLAFGNICLLAGIPHAITYGRDEPIRVLEEWQVVRRISTPPAELEAA
jgi:hypothetical protein